MKNRGFTLIELLSVIAILGIIGTIITVNLTASLNETNQKACDGFVKEIEEAACVYAGLANQPITCIRGNCPAIKLNTLLSEGLIEGEIDACTGEDVNLNETVTVTWDSNGEKKCEYNGVKIYER